MLQIFLDKFMVIPIWMDPFKNIGPNQNVVVNYHMLLQLPEESVLVSILFWKQFLKYK